MGKESLAVDLQVHFFRKVNFDLWDVLSAMERRGLGGIGLLNYKWEKTSLTVMGNELVQEKYEIKTLDNLTLFTNKVTREKRFILLGDEAGVQNQRWHILAIGVTEVRSSAPEDIIEEVLERGGLPIIDHPFADPQRMFKDIGREKEEELVRLCRRYAGSIALEWNSYCLPCVRGLLPGYSDVNKKVAGLAKEFSIPLVPTTDLHARNRRLLKAVGTSFIEIPYEAMDFENLLSSLKENVLSFMFRPRKRYVSFPHFVEAFGVPLIMRRHGGQ